MQLDPLLIDEVNLLLKFKLDTVQSGLKIHHDAEQRVQQAAQRLFDKGFISQVDGGYLTELGRELAEHSHNAINLLNSQRCL